MFFNWILPLIKTRINTEINDLTLSLRRETEISTSVAGRFSSYQGFWAVLKHSPLFGVGFDQVNYISNLSGRDFESHSGIIGFIGTSTGLFGMILFLYILKFIWDGGEKKKLKIKEEYQPDSLVMGRAIIVALFLEQLILYGGILNTDFWLPLSFAYLFIRTGQIQILKKEKTY